MNLGQTPVGFARVEGRGIDPVGAEPRGTGEPHCLERFELVLEIVNKNPDMMKALLADGEHVSVDGWRVVILDDELDVHVAQVVEGVRHIGLVVGAALVEYVGLVVMGEHD
jgi:hypothetical protein